MEVKTTAVSMQRLHQKALCRQFYLSPIKEASKQRTKLTQVEILKDVYHFVLIGRTTLVFLLFLNIRKTRRDTEMETHTQAKVKTCCQFNYVCMLLFPTSLRGGYRPLTSGSEAYIGTIMQNNFFLTMKAVLKFLMFNFPVLNYNFFNVSYIISFFCLIYVVTDFR